MAADGQRNLHMSVSSVMTKEVVTASASGKLKDAWLLMMEKGISGLPVVDDSGMLVGILSVTDISSAIADRVSKARSLRQMTSQPPDKETADREELRELSLAIRAVADTSVVALVPKGQEVLNLKPGDSLERAVKILAEKSVNRLPVVREGKVVGIITRQDVIEIIAGVSKKAHTQPTDAGKS
jgi:CBS domain-containing protein